MPVRLVCIDVDGTVSDRFERPTVAGAAAALDAVRAERPVRLVTNATSVPHARLAELLREQGLLEDPDDLVTPAAAARRVLTARGHAAGLLLVDDASRPDFDWFVEDADGPAVVVATEGHALRVADLQPAFRRVLDGASLYTLQRNRYFRKGDELVTDLGPLAAFLGYAADREADTLGKPSRLLFEGLARESGCALDDVAMIGDDAEFDASGSVRLGMAGLLVRTGKYREGDEERVDPPPTAVLDSIAELPAWLERQAR